MSRPWAGAGMVWQDHGTGAEKRTAGSILSRALGFLGGAGGEPSPDQQVPCQLRTEAGDGELPLPHSPEPATRSGTKYSTGWPWGVSAPGLQCLLMAPGTPRGFSGRKLLGGSPERGRKMPKPRGPGNRAIRQPDRYFLSCSWGPEMQGTWDHNDKSSP